MTKSTGQQELDEVIRLDTTKDSLIELTIVGTGNTSDGDCPYDISCEMGAYAAEALADNLLEMSCASKVRITPEEQAVLEAAEKWHLMDDGNTYTEMLDASDALSSAVAKMLLAREGKT